MVEYLGHLASTPTATPSNASDLEALRLAFFVHERAEASEWHAMARAKIRRRHRSGVAREH